ncbi:hypothetical protein NHX12_023581 [Muraenolepis orangiensis]|uniref:RING-type E3 ubiquitin transferase n=1 Tax=Muraenolepis orangiensis TaxID=630683 RepID=A0A9Q0IS71_9TELE|nr:hypothetical protein NHX12_023581 [Muraenolepis orangiensis]
MAAPVSKTWELSLYELHRSPQHHDHQGVSAPLLLRVYRHSTEIRKLVSRRSLRRDANFDALISKIYPSRREYDAHQERVLERLSLLHNKEALSSSIEKGLQEQESDNTTFSGGEDNGDAHSHLSHDSAPLAQEPAPLQQEPAPSRQPLPQNSSPLEAGPSVKRPRLSDGGSSPPAADRGSPAPPPRRLREGGASEIELEFKPHPQLVSSQEYSQTRFVKTTAHATVDHLSKYLALRIALEEGQSQPTDGEEEDGGRGPRDKGRSPSLTDVSEKQYTIYITTGEQFSTLNGSLTLELVNQKFWKIRKPLELYYAVNKDQPNPAPKPDPSPSHNSPHA